MDQSRQIELLQRVLEHVRAGTTDMGEIPSAFSRRLYSDPDRIAAEQRVLFREFPLVVGFSSQVSEAGSYFTHDLTGVPLLVVRGQDSTVRAFLNTCRHRGAKVTTQASGSGCRRFVCPYHAWSYDLDGRLHSVTERRCFPQVNLEQSGLVPVPCAERHGMIFATPTPGGPFDIDAYLGEFGADLESFGLARYQVTATKNVPANIDWKLMVEANQESYHINFLHGRTAGRRYRDQCSLADLSPPHSRSVLVHASTGRAPLAPEPGRWRLLDHADLVYFIFPNTLLLWAGGGVQAISPFPQGLGTSVMQGARLDPPEPATRAARDYAAAFYGNYWQTIMEDIRVSETIQLGSRAPTDVPLQLGRNEVTIAAFHGHIERALGRELVPPSASTSRPAESPAAKFALPLAPLPA